MTEGPFLKKIIVYIIPLILTGLLQCLYNAADLVVVGHYRGDLALAAVGTTGSLTNLILGLFMGLSVGAGVVVAYHLGALEHDRVTKVIHSAIAMAAVLGVFVGAVGFIFANDLLRLMDTPETVIDQATLYLRIIFCGVPASLLYNYCASMLNSTGETTRPLIFLSVSGIVNVILNVTLVVGFGMGVEGVAIGTIASQYLSATMILIYMTNIDGCVKFSFSKLCFDWPSIKRMLTIGIPSGIQSCLFSLSNVIIQSTVNSFGDVVVAGNTAAQNLEGFVYIAMNSVSRASLTFTGQNVGAKKYKNIKIIILQTVACAAVIGIVSGGVVLLFRDFFVGLYMSGDSQTAIDAAIRRLFYIMPTYFLCGIMDAACGVIRGMGRSMTAMIFSLLGACAFRILWINTVFAYVFPTVDCVYISYPISWLLVIIMDIVYLIYYYKKLTRKELAEPALTAL